ncbi:kirola-like [Olea europaea var. sylvestris]|uniref:kirola-like n=1 Tax=Olea europaea var. sylvestris TaxID=158386 RepID=UPI000C1D324E|nr:kirola-like [Olea europaea var. sylvestris]
MGLKGKLTAQIEMKAGGDVFHGLLSETPQQLPNISPNVIQGCDLHEGKWGTVGSVYIWKFIHDGKQKVGKDILEAIDKEKRSLTFNMIEGDLLELYKVFKIDFHVETHHGIDLVTWTLDYEKLKDDVEEPLTFLGALINLSKDIESYHLKAK